MKQFFAKSLIMGIYLGLALVSIKAQTSSTPQPTPSPKKTIFGLPVGEHKPVAEAELPEKKPTAEPASPRPSSLQSRQGASNGRIVAPPPNQAVLPLFPIAESQDNSFHGSGGYMHTDVHIFKNGDGSGSLNAVTHTWEVTQLRGFRGAVAVALLDENKKPLWVSGTQNYGVDGVMIGTHDRTENWHDTVPAQSMPQVRYIAIIQKWNPNSVFNDINNWLQGISKVVNELAPIIKTIKTITG